MTKARSARDRIGAPRENVVGVQLRALRQDRFGHLSGQEFCELLYRQTGMDISKSTLSKIENGTRSVLDYEVSYFCKVLDVSPNTLYGYSP